MNEDMLYKIHKYVVTFGKCRDGVRDYNLLASAVGGQQWYDDKIDKYIHISYSICANHVFTDGNKRTSFLVLKSLNRVGVLFDDDKITNCILELAKCNIDKDEFFKEVKESIIL